MTSLRHLVFLDKKLVSIENRDGTSLNISSVVDVAGDDLFLFLLESTGVVWICYKPWAKFDETTHLRFISFKAFEFEATSVFYCSLKHILIVIGREQECDRMLKFNSYDLLMFMNNFEQVPQLIQSTPLFPNLSEFRPDTNINIAISDCCSIVVISTELNGIYAYKNYIVPSDDQKLYIIPYAKLFKNDSGVPGGPGSEVAGREDDGRDPRVLIKKLHLFTIENVYYLFMLTDYEIVSFNLSENALVFRECSEAKYEVSCRLKNNQIATYKAGKILIYDMLKGLIKQIATNNSPPGLLKDQREPPPSSYRSINSAESSNVKLYCFNEYVIYCNIDNIFDNNNIILISIYSYLLDITFIAYSYYIPRLTYVVQSMNNLYLFTTNFNSAGAGNKELMTSNNILIFELKNKNIYERIEILIKKRLFKWAIKLAEYERRPQNEIEEIYKIYADWLYSKNKYNESILCYCRSGNSVEPCYVIQKFLVLNSKLYLYKYLYYLHLNNKDNYILTILLIQLLYNINYSAFSGALAGDGAGNSAEEEDLLTRDELAIINENDLDYKKELHKFLTKFGTTHKRSIKEAITECRNTNKYEFASLIANYQNDSQELLNILLEDLQDFQTAYQLLRNVSQSVQYQAILKHHKLLLNHDINELLDLIHKLFEDTAGTPSKPLNLRASGGSDGDGSKGDEEIKIDRIVNTFILENEFLVKLLDIFNHKSNSLLLYTIRLNLLLQQYYNLNRQPPSAERDEELLKMEDNILKLLNINSNNAQNELVSLLLCLLYNYKRGSIIMSIKIGYYNLPLILLDNENDSINLLDYVFNYGYNEPILYINILKLLLKYNNYIVIKKLLYNIQNYKLLKYQNIISIFNHYEHIQFQYIHDYIRNEFKKINDVIFEYNNDIKQDKLEYMNMKKNLVNLNTNYIIINNTNCSSCGLHLEYPSIHFYCKHSYHIYCVAQDNTCPRCSYNLPDANDNDDNFFKFLIGSNDPFNYISEQFNKFLNIT